MSSKFFDRYEFIKLNKSNYYSNTYHAYDKSLKLDVSIQIYKKNIVENYSDIINKYDRLARLEHPNIFKIYKIAYTEENELCIVFEYLDYMNLYQVLKTRSINEEDVLYIFYQICSALGFCHNHGIYHGEFYFKDIFIDYDNMTKIGGFNLISSVQTDINYLGEFLDKIFRMYGENKFSRPIKKIRDKCIDNQYPSVDAIIMDLKKISNFLKRYPGENRGQEDYAYMNTDSTRIDKSYKKKPSVFVTYILPIILAFIVTIFLIKIINIF